MADITGYESLQRRFRALSGGTATTGLMRQLGVAVVAEAKRRVPRRTGNLGRSIHVASATQSSVTVVAATNYAADVEFGTRPHEITPRARKALRFATGSGARLTGSPRKGADVVFATRVHHPGTRPKPFLKPAAEAAIQGAGVLNQIVTTWNEAK